MVLSNLYFKSNTVFWHDVIANLFFMWFCISWYTVCQAKKKKSISAISTNIISDLLALFHSLNIPLIPLILWVMHFCRLMNSIWINNEFYPHACQQLWTFFILFLGEIRCHFLFWNDALQILHHRPSQFHYRCWLTSLSDLNNHGSKSSGFWLVRLIRRPPWRTNQVTSYLT